MSYVDSTVISLPAVTICLDKKSVIKPDMKHGIEINNLTIQDQFKALYDFESLFIKCMVKAKIFKILNEQNYKNLFDTNYINCSNISPIIKSINLDK